MIRRPPRSTHCISSAASDVYKRQGKVSVSFGSLRNPYLLKKGANICLKETTSGIEMALCTCEQCCNFFDLQIAFALERMEDCKGVYSSTCPCYETSQMSFTETLQYQEHSICTQCKFDSHCKTFNPHAACLHYTPNYVIGNPFDTSPSDHGFKDLVRDKDRVADGIVKGDSCDCESEKVAYEGGAQAYKVFPKYQIVGSVEECVECLKDPFTLEASCYSVGVAREVDVRRRRLRGCAELHFGRLLRYLHSQQRTIPGIGCCG
eukprot:TRINITY_DN6330_c0_g1_i1.p1 TRINITY_DN6330_c0_g1~~TRINITY_DN6330_c0_g1_i1.p1  ORF type:complete len:271 (+),score=60.79 TRINITY_DN6330_c0_g1_i1:25-813(+)